MLTSMTERWKIAIDNGLSVGAVFIDFQKAFVTSTVAHDIYMYYHIHYMYMLLEYQDLFTNGS